MNAAMGFTAGAVALAGALVASAADGVRVG